MPIASDATIRDRLSSINKAEDFLIRVVQAVKKASAHQNGAVVRIGLQGKGTHPNFKIGQAGAPQSEHEAFDYNGVPFNTALQTHAWSSAAMGYPDIQALLSDLRAKRV